MNIKTLVLILAALSIVAAGCNGTKTDDEATKPVPKVTDAAEKAPEETPAVADADVPEELKHDAYAYLGLKRTEALRYAVTLPGQPASTASRVIKLVSVEDGKLTFDEQYTDSLAMLGNLTYEVTTDGVYTVKASAGEIGGRSMLMPAKLEPGATWESDSAIKLDSGGSADAKATYKVVGTEKVTTKAGEFEALKVTSTGTGKVAQDDVKLDTTMWLVRDMGMVKFTMKITRPDAPLELSFELAEK